MRMGEFEEVIIIPKITILAFSQVHNCIISINWVHMALTTINNYPPPTAPPKKPDWPDWARHNKIWEYERIEMAGHEYEQEWTKKGPEGTFCTDQATTNLSCLLMAFMADYPLE